MRPSGFLLDTNVLSELRKERCEPAVFRWQQSVAPHQSYISVITLLEIRRGIYKVGLKDPPFAQRLQQWLEQHVKVYFRQRILPIDEAVAEQCALFHQQAQPRPYADTLIAATAAVHQLKLATRNVDDFTDLGLQLENPWEPK